MFYFVFNFSLSRGYSYYFWDNWVCFYYRKYIYIYPWGNWQRDEPANTLFFLGLWGQFVNISGGGWPKVYILGVRLNFFGNTYILIIIFEKSICLEPS